MKNLNTQQLGQIYGTEQMEQSKLRIPACGEEIFQKYNYDWREYTNLDYESVDSIGLPDSCEMFGDLSLESITDNAEELYVHENLTTHDVCAFISFNSYPKLPAMDESAWNHWMEKLYDNFVITPMNTFFVHYFTYSEQTDFNFLNDLFRYLFTETFTLDHIVFILPSGYSKIKSYRDLTSLTTLNQIYPALYDNQYDTQSLLVCQRSLFFEKVVIRRALPEDNDDLVEILDADCKQLRKMYGDYYIAEIILKKDNTRQIIVAEVDNRAIGMICVNSHVNIGRLFECFELDTYNGLCKHTVDEIPFEIQTDSAGEIQSQLHNSSQLSMGEENIIEEINNLTIKDIEMDSNIEEDIYLSSEEESVTDINPPTTGEYNPFDIFKQFAFDSSSSSESSVCGQVWTSDATWFQTNTKLEIAKNKKAKRNGYSSQNSIWGQLSMNSSSKFLNIDKEKPVEPETESLVQPQTVPPCSAVNAFTIDLHGIRSDYDKRLTYLLLEAVFEIFPDREYCLITMPTSSATITGLEYFVKVYPRPFNYLDHELYYIYKYAIYGKLTVRIARAHDLPEIAQFINRVQKSKAVLQTIEELVTKYFHLKFVILVYSNNWPIGLAILEHCNEIFLFKSNFEVSSYVNMSPKDRIESSGFMKYFTLAPMFRKKTSVILTEMFRLTGFKQLYYFVKDSNTREPQSAILPLMFPVRPRRRIVYHLDKLGTHVTPNYVLEEPPLMALYTLGVNSIHKHKKIIPLRIVVVGTSTTGLSFLETIIFEKPAQMLTFPNLVLLTPSNHFESMIAENEKLKLARPSNVYYSYKYLQRLSLRTWVSVVHGRLKYIDKQNKIIITNHDRFIRYDLLYVFTGLEFGFPKHLALNATTPENGLTINSWDDVEVLQIKLTLIERKKIKTPIIVYGRTTEAYCIVNYIIETQPSIIPFVVLVLPPHDLNAEFVTSTFNDEFVDITIKNSLDKWDIKIYNGYKITKWDVDDRDFIRSVVLESNFELYNLECALLISCDNKTVALDTIKAFNDSGLVFDGRLVINKTFQTNDPNIFAAGPVTKYRRILYADAYRHEYYNSAEIGQEVAMRLIANFNPDIQLHDEIKDFNLVVHKFRLPNIVSCVLPTGLNYLHIAPPGRKIPHRAAALKDNYGVDIITGNQVHSKLNSSLINENSLSGYNSMYKLSNLASQHSHEEYNECRPINYFRCNLNEFNLVSTIVCLSEKKIDVQNLINLYGKHEKLLNNLYARNESNMIPDLFDFFQNSLWVYAVAHDRFPCLQRLNKAIFFDSMKNSDENLITDMITLFQNNSWSKLSEEKKLLIVASYLYANHAAIEKNVLKFLADYKDELPMFILPEDIGEFIKSLTYNTVTNNIHELFVRASEQKK